LDSIGGNSGIGDCTVFVRKTINPNSYLVSRLTLMKDNVQAEWRCVLPEDFYNFNVVPESAWKIIVKLNDDKALAPRDFDPNS
jgi:hypothetical protein